MYGASYQLYCQVTNFIVQLLTLLSCHKWPNMYSLPHLDAFIMAYKADQETASLESYTGRLDSDLGLSRIGAYQFHNNLKAALSMQNY